VTLAKAYAKINLALVVGPLRADGLHEIVTVVQRVDLHDDVELEPARGLSVEGFPEDTLVERALDELATVADVAPDWHVRIEKRIPVAAGLGGGSADAAAALLLANALLPSPLALAQLHELAARVGSDVPCLLRVGPQLATGAGTDLTALELPSDYVVLLLLPQGHVKESTASVYRAFDERSGAEGFDERSDALRDALARVREPRDLRSLPASDLAASPLAGGLLRHGAFRVDVTGAGPVMYGLFEDDEAAARASRALEDVGATWLARPIAGP